MKKFIFKSVLFITIIATIFTVILLQVDGYTDPFYIRFTTPQKDNLILGTSRSAQSLQPKIFDSILHKEFFNYSFTIAYSPFGPTYLNSIKKKLNPQAKNGIYIITVDPWSISDENPNDSTKFEENNLTLAYVNSVNVYPNFEYLLKEYEGRYYKLLKGKYYHRLRKSGGKMFLHNDGWLEVTIPMDSLSVAKRLNNSIESYRTNKLPNRKFSSLRLNYLKQTITFLKSHGKVYIVRLPVAPEMLKIEQELMPDFNEIINTVIPISNGYLDMTSENHLYQFIDGNHIWKESGKLTSEKIAKWIETKR